jgi:superfamily I DNA and/or RNA helicase
MQKYNLHSILAAFMWISAVLITAKTISTKPPKTFVLNFDITVKDNDIKLPYAVLTLIRNGSVEEQIKVGGSAKHVFVLLPDAEYTIEISKPGHVSKRLYVSTYDVPEKDLFVKNDNFLFKANVNIFKEIPGLDISILEEPIGKITYDKTKKDFDYDYRYTMAMKAALERLQRELLKRQKEIDEKEKEEKDKFVAEEREAIARQTGEQRILAQQAAEERKKTEEIARYQAKATEIAEKKKVEEAKAKVEAEERVKREQEQLAKSETEKKRKAEEEQQKQVQAEALAKAAEEERLLKEAEAKIITADAEAYAVQAVSKAIQNGGDSAVEFEIKKLQAQAVQELGRGSLGKIILLPTDVVSSLTNTLSRFTSKT